MTREEFTALIANVLTNPDVTRTLGNGRRAFWQEASGTIVIIDPGHADGGTAFRPPDRKAYVDRLK